MEGSQLLIYLSVIVEYFFEEENKYAIVSLRSEMKRAFGIIKCKFKC